jgi:hypothetical protein
MHRRIPSWPFVLPITALLSPAAEGADLQVGTGQTYAAIQDAVDAAMPGDTILVHVGTYAESITTNTVASESARIVLGAAGDGDVLVQGAVTLDGDYWDVQDIAFQPPAGERGFRVRGNFNRLLRIELSGGTSNGIDGAGIGNEVAESHIHNFDAGASDAHCVVLNPGAEDWVIRQNDIHDCSGDCIQLYANAATRLIKNTRIEHNHLHFTGALTRTENAIDVKDADGLIIFANEMHGFPDNKTAVFQKAPANIDMQCNVMYDGFTGVEFRQEDGGFVENVVFARNLMRDHSEYALKFDGTVNASVYHNTFVDIGNDGLRIELAGLDGGAVQNNLWVRTGNVDAGNFTADHNGFFTVGNIGIASPSDVNADPLLDANYQLGDASPMIDKGADLGQPFEGAAPDIGWHELGADSCAAPGPGTGGSAAQGSGGASAQNGAAVGAGGGANADGSGEEAGGCGCRQAGAPTSARAGLSCFLALALSISARSRRPSRSRR